MKQKMKKILVLLVIAMILLTACQPTPDDPVVISRDNTEKEVYESSQDTEKHEVAFIYDTPELKKERFSIIEDSLDIEIDAVVNMPEINRVPVAKITSDFFTQERIDEFINYFAEGGTLINEYIMTKTDYDSWIVDAKRGHLVDGEYVYDEGSEKWVKQLLEEREEAPDEDIQEPIDDYSVSDGNEISCRVIKNEEVMGYFTLSEDQFLFSTNIPFRLADKKYYDNITGEIKELSSKEILITEDAAIKTAHDTLQSLGIEGMEVAETYKVYYTGNDTLGDIKYGGYGIVFMREYGGMMPANIKSFNRGKDDKFDVSPPISVETITIYVNEHGIIELFCWENPIKIIETLTEHVDIMSFEAIMKRLKEFSKLQFGYKGDNLGDVMSVMKIYKICFNLMYLPIKNNPTEFMYAPCWVFTYKTLPEYTEEQKNFGYTEPQWDIVGEEYLIFSAVDGASVSAYPADWMESNKND